VGKFTGKKLTIEEKAYLQQFLDSGDLEMAGLVEMALRVGMVDDWFLYCTA
jgi:hypothetical protein